MVDGCWSRCSIHGVGIGLVGPGVNDNLCSYRTGSQRRFLSRPSQYMPAFTRTRSKCVNHDKEGGIRVAAPSFTHSPH
jgi:hypothetical protein